MILCASNVNAYSTIDALMQLVFIDFGNCSSFVWYRVNTLRLRQNGRHFADDIFKYIFLNEYFWIPVKISLKFVPKGPINIIPTLVQIMGWHRPGDRLLSEPMVVSLPTHICVTWPQWVNAWIHYDWLLLQIMALLHNVLPFMTSCLLECWKSFFF